MLRERKAQTALEYVIILSAIVIALLAGRAFIKTAINQGVTDASDSMTRATARLP